MMIDGSSLSNVVELTVDQSSCTRSRFTIHSVYPEPDVVSGMLMGGMQWKVQGNIPFRATMTVSNIVSNDSDDIDME